MNLSDQDKAFVSSVYSRYAAGTLKVGRTAWLDFPKKGFQRFIFRCHAFFLRFKPTSTKEKLLNEFCERALSKVPKVVNLNKPEAYINRDITFDNNDFQILSSEFAFMGLSRDAFFVSPIAKFMVLLHELAHFTGFDLQRRELLYSSCPEEKEQEPWVKPEHLSNYCKEEITAEMTMLLVLRRFKMLTETCYNETALESGMNYINKYILLLHKVDPTSKPHTFNMLSRCLMSAKRAHRKIIQMAA